MKPEKRKTADRKNSVIDKSSSAKLTKPAAVKSGRVQKSAKSKSGKQQKSAKNAAKNATKSTKNASMNKKALKPIANGIIKASSTAAQSGKASPKKPPKFCYVVDGLLAGMGRPTQHGHMQFLCDKGFKYLVTLTLNKPRAIAEYPGEGLEWVHIPIQDETPPSVEQITRFVSLIDKAKAENTSVAAHCAWGRGRTGTMLACYLAKSRGLSVEGAVEEIRRLRPGSIDTEGQMDSLRKYVASIRG